MPIGGTSYQPGAQPMQPGGAPRRALTPQEAVRILSLRLPKSPQNSPVPNALLTSAGGGATPNLSAVLQALMQATRRPGGGSRELVSDLGSPAVDHGLGGFRTYSDLPPRVVIGDQGRAPVVDPVPDQTETPLFDTGVPTIRNFPFQRKPSFELEGPLF